MKKILNISKIGVGVATALLMAATACTGDFESFNTNHNAAQDVDLTSLITSMELDAVYPTTGETTVPVNRYQTGWNLLADHYAGYMACANHFEGGNCPMVYNLSNGWRNTVFEVAFTQVMPLWLSLKYGYDQGLIPAHVMAVADVLKVLTLHRASDYYGPLPVLKFGESRNPYDSQEVLYHHFFETLDTSIAALKELLAIAPDDKTLAKVDAIYGGDYSKWLKLANSIKLRLAIRIRYVEPVLSAKYAEEAINAGVITTTDDNAMLKSFNAITVNNPFEMLWSSYNDARMGATMDSYLNGYEDPRRAAMFQKASDGKFHGVRNGQGLTEQNFYTNMSAPNIFADTPMRWFMASESAFLKAEYYLMKGDKGSAKTAYEEGVRLSFVENGLSASAADSYLSSDKTPAKFDDVSGRPDKQGANARGRISPKWAEDGNELERVITQKWIALYPNGMEAWAEFRRTGFPKIYPILEGSQDATVDKNTQIRRIIFPKIEYANNAGAVGAATRLLNGPDAGGTKLWWDRK